MTAGRGEFETKSHILFRWKQTLNSGDAFANFRAVARDNSFPYKSRFFDDFVRTDDYRWFIPEEVNK
jgi:hypothetical protein